jgi:hypothetical protein
VKKKRKKKQKIDLNFASLCFVSKQKLLNRSEVKNLNRKKRKKREKKRKKYEKKRKNILEFRFALFHFEAKIIKVKRSEKFEAKISEKKQKKEMKFYSEIVKHK